MRSHSFIGQHNGHIAMQAHNANHTNVRSPLATTYIKYVAIDTYLTSWFNQHATLHRGLRNTQCGTPIDSLLDGRTGHPQPVTHSALACIGRAQSVSAPAPYMHSPYHSKAYHYHTATLRRFRVSQQLNASSHCPPPSPPRT